MIEVKGNSILEDLAEILGKDPSDIQVTFDRFRDSTQGCGPHCHAWDPKADKYCPNHEAAIERGEYKRDFKIAKVIP